MDGGAKAKKLSAAKKKLKEFQKKQFDFEKAEHLSQNGSLNEEHHSVGSGQINGSLPMGASSSSTGLVIPPQQTQQQADDIERLQMERNLSPSRGNLTVDEPVALPETAHLTSQIEELKSYNVSLQKQILDEREAFGEQMQLQLGQLREQIQIHAQTIGILVGEKSQLQAALSQTKLAAETRQDENQELVGRLSASRQRVVELEKQVAISTEQLQKAEKHSAEMSKQIDKLRAECSAALNSTQELKRRHDELQERYLNKESELNESVASVRMLKNELSMTKVYLEQLSANASKADVTETQQLNAQNEQLKAQNQELSRSLKQAIDTAEAYKVERDNFKRRHQTDLSGLEDHIQTLNRRIGALSNEIEGHLQKNSQLETQVTELREKIRVAEENKLLSNQNLNESSGSQESVDLKMKDATIASLGQQLATAKRDLEELVANNVHFHQVVLDKDATIETLRGRLAELERASGDYRSVLASVEDVRTALSRALAQNVKLKTEYEELQHAFVKITNEKVELLDQLASAQKSTTVSSTPIEASQKVVVDTQEAQCETNFDDEVAHSSTPEIQAVDHDECNKKISELEFRVSEYAFKIAELEIKIAKNSGKNSSTHSSQSSSETDIPVLANPPIDMVNFASQNKAEQLETVQQALQHLEDRFASVMREKADLLDQKERLEHLVIQLQSETDTIGEYITLYQKQRTTLKQQSDENARFMQQLTSERKLMNARMSELQSLVLKLVASKSVEPVRVVSTGPDFTAPTHTPPKCGDSPANGMKMEEEWPDLIGEGDVQGGENSSFTDVPPDPVSSRILHLLTSMTSSMLTNNEDADVTSLAVSEGTASVLAQMTPNTRMLVNRRIQSLRRHQQNFSKQSPGECPCCRGQILII